MDVQAPWITEMMATGTCRQYEAYYGLDSERDEDEEYEGEDDE